MYGYENKNEDDIQIETNLLIARQKETVFLEK